MVTYEVYSYDKMKGYELIGILPERRKDPKRITKESVLKWGRMLWVAVKMIRILFSNRRS